MLGKLLHTLPNVGATGLEGLIARLLRELTGLEFHLANAGSQHGRDGQARLGFGSIMFECKNYLQTTSLNSRELVAELVQAMGTDGDLDLWILATSRTVTAQILNELNTVSRGLVEILTLSCEPDGSGALDILCSAFPEIVLGFFRDAEINKEVKAVLQRISASTDCEQRLHVLRQKLISPGTGWPAWRKRTAQQWNALVLNKADCRARLGQVLDVANPEAHSIFRSKADATLDQWWSLWNEKHAPLVVLGSDGDGKSWAVAQWLTKMTSSDAASFPPIVFISSKQTTGEPRIDELIAKVVSRDLNDLGADDSNWSRRLHRWRSHPDCREGIPLAIIILDGLNERHKPQFWRELIEGALSSDWRNNVALICTTRTGHWEHEFASLDHMCFEVCHVQPYDDDELKKALGAHGRSLEDFPNEVHSLMRKPRYLNRAVKHHEQLEKSGDFTVARLVYEDWRDKLNQKSLPLSDAAFNDLLRNLANNHRDGVKNFTAGAVLELMPHHSGQDETFQELCTSGVLINHGGRLKVGEAQLALGLGLLLCDTLKSNEEGTDLNELIASWSEQNTGIDLESKILEHATLHSLVAEFSTEARVALLFAWLNSQNPPTTFEQPVEGRLNAYIPQRSDAYFALAEKIWSGKYDHPWGQEVLIVGFIRWAMSLAEIPESLLTYLGRWLGIVPKDGPPIFRDSDKVALRQEYSNERLCETLNTQVADGLVTYAGHSLLVTGDDGWLRLPRVALAIISHLPKVSPFIPHILSSILSEALFNYPEKTELFEWILRKSTIPISETTFTFLKDMERTASMPVQRASARTCLYLGSVDGWKKWETFDNEKLFPTPQHIIEARKDPLNSYFPLGKDQLESYARMEDFNPLKFIGLGASEFSTDHELNMPENLGTLLAPLIHLMPEQRSWIGTTKDRMTNARPLFARYCPKELVKAIRGAFNNYNYETSGPINHLAFFAFEYDLILTAQERSNIAALCKEQQNKIQELPDREVIASYLLGVTLPLWANNEQLDIVMTRDEEALDLVCLGAAFLVDGELTMPTPNTDRQWARLLWYLSETKKALIPQNMLVQLLSHEDDYVRNCAFHYLDRCSTEEEQTYWIRSADWCWQPSMNQKEAEFGSYLTIKYRDDLATEEVLDRIAPYKHGLALSLRANNAEQWQTLGQWINSSLSAMTEYPLPTDLPKIEILYSDANVQPPFRMSLAEPKNKNIKFVRSESHWGGRNPDSVEPFFNFNMEAERARRQSCQKRLKEICENAASAGHYWIDRIFQKHCFSKLTEISPNLVNGWIQSATPLGPASKQNIFRAQMFYEALCETLLCDISWHEEAAQLYTALDNADTFAHVIENNIDVKHLSNVLMNSPQSGPVESLWERTLDKCSSDYDLLNFALSLKAAKREDARNWCRAKITHDLNSEVPLYQARAHALLGFSGDSTNAAWLQDQVEEPCVWPKEVQRNAQKMLRHEIAAKHWFREFCRESENDKAWCAFILFLESADRRCWLWIEDEVGAAPLNREKIRFFELNKQTIRNHCKENEKKLKDEFLNCKADPGLSPWLKITFF